jgi:predicted permease
MKYVLRILLFSFFALIAYGYYLKNNGLAGGDKWVGFGVLLLTFVLMPLFIFHRYRKKNVKDYILKNQQKKEENTGNQ